MADQTTFVDGLCKIGQSVLNFPKPHLKEREEDIHRAERCGSGGLMKKALLFGASGFVGSFLPLHPLGVLE